MFITFGQSFQWTEHGLLMVDGVLVVLDAVEDLRLGPGPALTQRQLTAVQTVREMLFKHRRVTETLVVVG